MLATLLLALTLVDIFKVVLVLCLFGFLVHLALTYIPVSPPVKQIIIVVLVILLILWALERWGGLLNL